MRNFRITLAFLFSLAASLAAARPDDEKKSEVTHDFDEGSHLPSRHRRRQDHNHKRADPVVRKIVWCWPLTDSTRVFCHFPCWLSSWSRTVRARIWLWCEWHEERVTYSNSLHALFFSLCDYLEKRDREKKRKDTEEKSNVLQQCSEFDLCQSKQSFHRTRRNKSSVEKQRYAFSLWSRSDKSTTC